MTMSDKEFIRGIRREIIASNLQTYRELFAGTRPEDAADQYWIDALQLFNELDDAGREVLFSIIRQVMVDTVSNLFSIFDGVTEFLAQDDTFEVRIGDKNLAGSLQDQFLAAEEESRD
jgi:hypothetical protein